MPNIPRNAATAPNNAINNLSSIKHNPDNPEQIPKKCGVVSPNHDPQWPAMPAIKRNRCSSMHVCPHGGQGLTHTMLAIPQDRACCKPCVALQLSCTTHPTCTTHADKTIIDGQAGPTYLSHVFWRRQAERRARSEDVFRLSPRSFFGTANTCWREEFV